MNYNLLENGNNITRIDISFGNIKALPILPLNLEILHADNNFELECIPVFPIGLRVLSICLTGITYLTGLPNTLEELYVSENPGITIDNLPSNLKTFIANSCELERVPTLPEGLLTLMVDGNYLEELPTLPSTIQILIASNNELLLVPVDITNLTELTVLLIQNNVIRWLPPLPHRLKELNCAENNLKRLPMLPETLTDFVFFGNPLIYEFHNKRVSSKDYVNAVNRFVRFMSLSRIRRWIFDYIEKTKDTFIHSSNPSFSSMSSFLTVSSIDPWLSPEYHEDEFIFI